MRGVGRALDRHWFAPASLRDLALVRIALVGSQLLLFYPDLDWQFELARTSGEAFDALPVLRLLLLPFEVPDLLADPLLKGPSLRPEPMFLHAVWWGGVVAGAGGLIGLFTTPCMLIFAWSNLALTAHGYSYGELHHPEAVMMVALVVLALSPCGARWSADDLRKRLWLSHETKRFRASRDESDLSPFARWPLRVVQWMLVLAYLSAGLYKVCTAGLDWFNGYTLAYYLMTDSVLHGSLGIPLTGFPLLLSLLSIASVAYELFFAAAIFFPRWTWVFVVAGYLLHLGIALTLGAPFYQFLFLFSVFVENLRRGWPERWRRPARAPRWQVLYDERCPLCVPDLTFLEYWDTGRRIAWVSTRGEAGATPRTLPAGLQVVDPEGRSYRGLAALRALLGRLPPLWPLLPLTFGPGARWMGSRFSSFVDRGPFSAPYGAGTVSP